MAWTRKPHLHLEAMQFKKTNDVIVVPNAVLVGYCVDCGLIICRLTYFN